MASPSPSPSPQAAATVTVWLHDASFTRVAQVGLPVPLPVLVSYAGGYYCWSYVRGGYMQATPYAASVSALSNKDASAVADPEF